MDKQRLTASSESPETPQPALKKKLRGNASTHHLNQKDGVKIEPQSQKRNIPKSPETFAKKKLKALIDSG